MNKSTISGVAFVSTVTLIFIAIAISLTPNVYAEGNALSPPGKCFTKTFMYEYLADNDLTWHCKDYYIRGLEVQLWYKGCDYYFVGNLYTGRCGSISLCGLPAGDYYLNWTWNGEWMQHYFTLDCSQKEFDLGINYLEPKGGERATPLLFIIPHPFSKCFI